MVIGALSLSPLVLGFLVGLATPAIAPTQAQALVVKESVRMHTLSKYNNAYSLTDTQLAELLSAIGFKGKALAQAWAISKKESHGSPLNHNGNLSTGDNSYGLFQINMLGSLGDSRRAKFGLASNAELLNPVVNAKIAYHMSNEGKDWSAWKGVHQAVVQDWMKKFPSKATTTSAHKAVAKAKAVAKVVQKAKAKQKPKQKQ